MKTTIALLLLFTAFVNCLAQAPQSDGQQFIRIEAPVTALAHVRVIDGTGAAPLDDQTIVLMARSNQLRRAQLPTFQRTRRYSI